MDEYFAGLGIMTIIKNLEHERDKYASHLQKILEEDEDTGMSRIWDYVFEDKTAVKIWEMLIKEEKITVTGFQKALPV